MKHLILITIIAAASSIYGQEKKLTFKFGTNTSDTTRSNDNFELSFGQNLLFISNSKQIDLHQQAGIVLPTTSVLFLSEFRPQKFIKIPLFMNIATESKQFLVDGQLINEKASPTFGTGLSFAIANLQIKDDASVVLEGGPLMSFILDNKNNIRLSPIIAGRLKILRGEHFLMYIGLNYSIGVNTFGVLYGTGTSF